MLKTYKERALYTSKIKPFINKSLIKIITGQRRVGKSYLLFQLIDYLKKQNINEKRILYINKELYKFDRIKTYIDLLKYIKEYFKNVRSKKYVFIDEIQDIRNFEKALRDLQTDESYDIYCTGSNANLLSSEIATGLSGRYIEFQVYPLSYLEFLDFHNFKNDKFSLEKYIRYGGLPYLIHLEMEDEIIYGYLKSIYNSIVLKDIVSRYEVRNIDFFNRLVIFLAEHTGSLFSAKKISDYLKSQKMSISPGVVLNYLTYLNSAYFIFQVKRMDIIGKRIFQINEKYYFNDLGIRHSMIGFNQMHINKILENLVYIHLRRLGYEVKVGCLNELEIDFVAHKKDIKIYVQTAYILENEKTRKREFNSLLSINDNYRKVLISMDEISGGNYEGIEHMHISDFLSSMDF